MNANWDPSDRLDLPCAEEMSNYDRATIARGVTSLELMERAGQAIFEKLRETETLSAGLGILCGPGNNGGDGLVVGRQLLSAGIKHWIVVASASRYSVEFVVQGESYLQAGGTLLGYGPDPFPAELTPIALINLERLSKLFADVPLVLDALLGTGQNRAPTGSIAGILRLLSQTRKRTVAIDLPTGVDGSTGQAFEHALTADRTICIELVKRGLLQYPARAHCGEIDIVKIGISREAPSEFSLIDPDQIGLSKRDPASHKGDYGSVLVIGSSRDMPGASILAAQGALRVGAGLVTKVHSQGTSLSGLSPEVMLREVDDSGQGFLGNNALEPIFENSRKFNAVVLGPGLGTHSDTAALVKAVLKRLKPLEISVVVDADALNILALERDKTDYVGDHCVLTPHPGEMARLLQRDVASISQDRFGAVKTLSQQTGATVVLKGAGTLVYSKGSGSINCSGNPYMASGGAGDVLSGVIAGLLAQGLSPSDAAKIGVYIHGRAGDLAHIVTNGPVSASDLAGFLPQALGELTAQDSE